jgi:hypothetical protein
MIRRRNRETNEIEKYLSRGYIFRSKYFGLFLHQFWSSDPDHPHDHPWANLTFVLSGGYHEFNVDGTSKWRGRGHLKLRQAQLFHRIAIGPHSAGSNWTLFAHFKRTRRWGFLTNEGWLGAKDYGDKYSCPVEEEGVDYEIRGRLFPRVVELGK